MSTMTVTDPRVVKVLLSDPAGTYLSAYLDDVRSIAEAAARVGRSVQRTHYWTKRFLDLGLIEVCEVVQRAGRPIRRYRCVADEFIIRAEALPPGVFESQMQEIHRALTRSFERSYPDVVRDGDLYIHHTGGASGICYDRRPRADRPMPKDAVQSSFTLLLTAEEAGRLRDELTDLRDRWLEAGARDAPGRQPYLSVVAITPLSED